MPIFEVDPEQFSDTEIRIYTQIARVACVKIGDACAKAADRIKISRCLLDSKAAIIKTSPGFYRIGVNYKQNVPGTIFGICHELLHYDQMRRGDLEFHGRTKIKWKGELFDAIEDATNEANTAEYLAQPWEAEVFAMHNDFAVSVLDTLTVSDRITLIREWQVYARRLIVSSVAASLGLTGNNEIEIDVVVLGDDYRVA